MTAASMWPEYVIRREDVLRLFQEPPSLRGVYLLEVTLGEDGPHIRFRFNLREFPANPPPSWTTGGFNTVQVTMGFWGLSEVSLVGFALENRVDMEFARTGKMIEFQVAGTTRIAGKASGLLVQKVSAYRRVPRSGPPTA